jgi:hypothetical protein
MLVVVIEPNLTHRDYVLITCALLKFVVKFTIPGIGFMRMKTLGAPHVVVLGGNLLNNPLVVS